MPPTSIYAAYKNKFNLFTLALGSYFDDFSSAISNTISATDDTHLVFRELLEFAGIFYTADPQSPGCMLLGADNFGKDPAIQTLINQHVATFEAKLAEKLAIKGVANPNDMAKVLLSLLTGLSGRAKNGADNDELLISIEFLCAALDC